MPLRNQFNTEGEWLAHLRIYFAAKALQSVIVAYSAVSGDDDELSAENAICEGFGAITAVKFTGSDGTSGPMTYAQAYAMDAYCLADAMLRAREVQP